jgi:hypothetical protein
MPFIRSGDKLNHIAGEILFFFINPKEKSIPACKEPVNAFAQKERLKMKR